MNKKIKEAGKLMGMAAGGTFLVTSALVAVLLGLMIIVVFFFVIADIPKEAHRKAAIAAQYQTPMDEKYVGLRWISEGGTRAEMYFDVFEEGEPPRGVCIFDGKEYEVILVGPFGREGWDSRDYYVLDAETELTGEEPESFLFRGSLHWRVGKAAFYYTFDNGEEHITLLDFRPVKIPVEALDGA